MPRLPGPVPPGLEQQRALGPAWGDWLDRLPGRFAEVAEEWELTCEGPLWHGHTSLVAPVLTREGQRAALKLTCDADEESEHEALALQHWHGRGAVRLLRADPGRRAMLLERLHPTDLTDVWDLEACETVAGLYAELHRPAPPQLRLLTSYVERSGAALASLPRSAPLPRRLVEQAVALGRDLVADPASVGTLIHGDLHYANVLAGDRAPWLAIDPKPVSGDPHYEVAPLLWNRVAELEGDLRGGVRRRFHATIDAAGLDEDRARDWVVVRMLHNALWAIQDAADGPAGADATWLTTCVAIAKAVQD